MPKLWGSPCPSLPCFLALELFLLHCLSQTIFSQDSYFIHCTGETVAPGLSRVLKKSKIPLVLLHYLLQKIEGGCSEREELHEEIRESNNLPAVAIKFCMMLITSSNPDFSQVVTGNCKPWDMTCTSPVCSQLPLKSVKAVV